MHDFLPHEEKTKNVYPKTIPSTLKSKKRREKKVDEGRKVEKKQRPE